MVTVYGFQILDPANNCYVDHPSKRTAEAIKAIGGKILRGTAEDVNEAYLDENGFYYPRY
jgi:hypothetical protein